MRSGMTVALFLFVTALLACGDTRVELKLGERFTIPSDARNVSKRVLIEGSAEQISYETELEYPSQDAIEIHRNNLLALDWSRCNGPNQRWTAHLDSTGGSETKIYQIIDYWVAHDKGLLAVLSAMYQSELIEENIPDNIQQIVRIRIDKPTDINNELEALRIKCDGPSLTMIY